MNPLGRIADKIKRNAEIKRRAHIYAALMEDARYTDVLVTIFKSKIHEKETMMLSIQGNSPEEIGTKYAILQAQRDVYLQIIGAPEKFFQATEKITKEENE